MLAFMYEFPFCSMHLDGRSLGPSFPWTFPMPHPPMPPPFPSLFPGVVVDVVGKYLYKITSPSGDRVVPLIVDVDLVGRTKVRGA